MKARSTRSVVRKASTVEKKIRRRASRAVPASLLVLLIIIGGALPGPTSVSSARGGYLPMTMLMSPYQSAVQWEAQRLIEHPTVVQAKQWATSYLSTTSLAADPANSADLQAYVDSLAYCLALDVVHGNQANPEFLWAGFPGSQYGMDNPDTIYRGVHVNESSSYIISGRRKEWNKSNGLYFELFDRMWGDGGMATSLGFLDHDQLITDPDGSFLITVDASEGIPGANHIQLKPGSAILAVRDTLVDWADEMPAELHIDRISGPEVVLLTKDQEAAEVARLIGTTAEFLSNYTMGILSNLPLPNWLPQPFPTPGGLPTQMSSIGKFQLAPDQALIVTIDPANADYMGFELGSYWFIAMNYWQHTSSLNKGQVAVNPDGTITYVLSARDPGVWNWIDTVNHDVGLIFVRWQNLPLNPDGTVVTPPMPGCQVVPFLEIDSNLPSGTVMVDSKDRRAQLRKRQLELGRRGAPYTKKKNCLQSMRRLFR